MRTRALAALLIAAFGCSDADPPLPGDGAGGSGASSSGAGLGEPSSGSGGDAGAGGGGTTAPSCEGLKDDAAHPPPSQGPHAYAPPGDFMPGRPGFPAVGETYVDPVFGCTVRRLTDVLPGWGNSLIYSRNGFWNADGTLYASNPNAMGRIDLVDGDTGGVVHGDVQFGTEGSFSPVDPDVYFMFGYLEDELREVHVSNGQSTVIKTLPAALESLGGSVDWIDRTGRYFLLRYAGGLHVWDRQTDTIYGGTVPATFGTGWAGLSPDGDYLIIGGHNGADFEHWSFAVDHETQTLSTSGIMFWSLCGPHSDVATANDGKTYLVGFNCTDQPEVYRIDVTLPQSTGDIEKQKADNVRLFGIDWQDAGHFSCPSIGPNRDWCFAEIASGDDVFSEMGAWRPYKQEIVMAQLVPPFEVRRLAHHRSRSPFSDYVRQPRVNASWDGSRAAFASDYGYDSGATAYSDIFYVDLR